jgi:hypothetical protein
MRARRYVMLLPVCLLLPLLVWAGNITSGTDEQAKLPFWQYQDNGMSVRLVQRLPDQTRGFFLARGFSTSQAELIAQSCVFQTVFKNISHNHLPSPLTYNLRDWIVTHQGKTGAMKIREDWDTQWQDMQVKAAPRIAFEWSLLPTLQTYQAGDYNWGMSVFNLKPGSEFDLTLTWQQHGKQQRAVIRDMRCAADVPSQPDLP